MKQTKLAELKTWMEFRRDTISPHDVGATYRKGVWQKVIDHARLLLSQESSEQAKQPQRQDSLQEQLADVRKVANRMGCYDAEDWIVSMSGRTFNAPSEQARVEGLVGELQKWSSGCMDGPDFPLRGCPGMIAFNEILSRHTTKEAK